MSLAGRRDLQRYAAPRQRWWTLFAAATILVGLFSAFGLTTGQRVQPAEAASGSGLFVFGSTTGATFTSGHSSGGNYLVGWGSVEPQNGAYSWSGIDQAIARAEAANKTIVLRVYTNWSAYKQGTPAWFFNTPGADHYYPSSSAQSKSYESPVPWDPTFQEHFGDFVQALGQRYDGNDAIEFIQITGIGVYGEFYLGQRSPDGYTRENHLASARFWIDEWRSAFSSTDLAFMANGIGHQIGEYAADHAVSRGYFLQSNNHANTVATRAILNAHDHETKIIVEAEDGGCPSPTLATGFEQQMDETFSFGYEIDYLMLCYQTFTDAATKAFLPDVEDRLRSSSTVTSPSTPAAPTATSTPVPPTATSPSGGGGGGSGIESDDFNTSGLDTSLWSLVDPIGGGSATTVGAGTGNAQLRISVPGGVSHNPYHVNRSVRVMQSASNSDFQIVAKFDSPVSQLYQTQGLLIEQDSNDWLRFDVYSDGSNTKMYAGSTVNGTTSTKKNVTVSTGTPIWLRITRQGSQWTHAYSYNGTSWTTFVTYSRSMSVTAVGVFGANHGTSSIAAHTVLVDYFFNTAAPISPEDGTTALSSAAAPAATATPTATTVPSTPTPSATQASQQASPTPTATSTSRSRSWSR